MAEESGVLEDDDATLAILSELGERWASCSVAIRRAFRSSSREGRKVLVQERMMLERRSQERHREVAMLGGAVSMSKLTPEQRSSKASAAANARWSKYKCPPDTHLMLGDAQTASASASASASAERSEKNPAPAGEIQAPSNGINEPVARAVNGLVAGISSAMSRAAPRAPLMVQVREQLDHLEPAARKVMHGFAGWLVKTGVQDDECVLRFLAHALEHKPNNLHAYYAPNGAARATIEGHYRADSQERESKRWKAEEWDWLRQFKAQMT